MTNNVLVGVKDIGQRLFGGYAELLRIPHTARFSVGSVIACMPFPMVGMTITISVQHYYGNYSLAGALTAVQAIALAVASPVLGKLVDKFGQRQVSIPTIIVWIIAAISLHYRPRTVMDPVLHRAVHGGDSAVGRDEPSTLDHIAQRGCGKNEPRAVPIRRIRRMHVGDRQSAGIHLGRNFRSAGVLIHRHVRGDWRADVPDGAFYRTEIANAVGS